MTSNPLALRFVSTHVGQTLLSVAQNVMQIVVTQDSAFVARPAFAADAGRHAVMHRMINEKLRQMQNLTQDPDKRSISCSTCHRGAIDPVTAER